MYIYIYIYHVYVYTCLYVYVYIYTQITWYDWYVLSSFIIWELGAFLIFVIADYPHKLSHYIGPISFQCFAFLLVPLRILDDRFHFGCSDLPMVYYPTLQIMILLVMTKSYKHLNTWLFSQMGSPPKNVKTNCSGKFDGKFPILMSLARLHPNSQEVQGGEIIFCSNHLIEFGKVI